MVTEVHQLKRFGSDFLQAVRYVLKLPKKSFVQCFGTGKVLLEDFLKTIQQYEIPANINHLRILIGWK